MFILSKYNNMKNSLLFLHAKTVSVAFSALLTLFAACDKGVDADEAFVSDVTNSQLASPNQEDIKFALSPDGATLIVEWPVVHGAGGYEFTLYNVDDPANPKVVGVEKEVIDGCTATRNVDSDTKYQVAVRTLGNEKYNNAAATDATAASYSTLAPTDATVPAGSDLNQWLADNVIPGDKIGEEYTIDLMPGAEYTLSDVMDFENQQVAIRGDKVNHARIKLTGEAAFLTNNGLKLKFVDLDCAEKTSDRLLGLSNTPDAASQVTSGEYVVANPVLLQGCHITNLKGYLFYDGSSNKYCIDYMGLSDCYVQLAQDNVVLRAAKSTIIRLDVVKSTLASSVQAGQFFLQISGQRPNKITGRTGAEINFKNTTFYNLAYNKDFVNWNNYRGQSCVTLNFDSTVFAECGRGDITNKMQGNANMKHNYQNNAYWYNGSGKDKYDTGALFADPQFENPAEGRFTPRNAEFVSKRIGDPRWLAE